MSFARNCTFEGHNTVYSDCNLIHTHLGRFSYVNHSSTLHNVTVGRFCSIGPEVLAGLGRHPTRNFVSTHPIFYSNQKQAQISFVKDSKFSEYEEIEIGNDVWIGARVIIADGVKIGDGAIVYSGAVVTTDVAPYSIVAGVPATTVRMRFLEAEIEQLMALKWWEKDVEWLGEHIKEFHNISEFLEVKSDCNS